MAPALRPTWAQRRQSQPRPSRPVRSTRNAVKSYREESSEDEQDVEPTHSPQQPGRQRQCVRELLTGLSSQSSASDSELSEPDSVDQQQQPRPLLSSKLSTRPKRPISSTKSSNSAKNVSPRKRRRVVQHGKKGKQNDAAPTPSADTGKIPPWQNLPYLILFDIFIRASQPLYDVGFVARQPSIQWLLDVSRLCRPFFEPAMAALYYSPPLFPASRCHGLLNLLATPQEHLTTDYRCLIKQLEIDVPQLLFYKNGPSLGYFDLGKLVELTPQLRYLRLYHRDDLVLNTDERPPVASSRWPYPLEIFDTLDINHTRLRSWDWNARLLETPKLLDLMGEVHLRPLFHGVQELTLLNISGNERDKDADQLSQQILASSLSSLPKLQSIHFERCSIVTDTLLSNLPANLQTLSITNCTGVSSDNLGAFLSSHGQCLQELFLSQNRHLNLSFMVNLAEWCPQLKALGVDLTFYDPKFHDVEPHFDNLLVDADAPSWPTTLQSIELNQLRKWTDATAENFFASLVRAAPKLPDLRRLIIKAILKIGWRDRATFRDKWIRRIENAFMRKSAPPDPSLRSISRQPKQSPVENPSVSAKKEEECGEAHSGAPSLKNEEECASSRDSGNPSGPVEIDEECGEDHSGASSRDTPHSSAPPTSTTRKSSRIAQKRLSDLSTDLSSGRNDSPASDTKISRRKSRMQKMCDVVLIRIDNLRPSEAQFREDDFLDDEPSGDDDWDGTDPIPGDGYAW